MELPSPTIDGNKRVLKMPETRSVPEQDRVSLSVAEGIRVKTAPVGLPVRPQAGTRPMSRPDSDGGSQIGPNVVD
ncbi:hypothetical protein Tco_0838186 [Tanacetum coccineum]|uniref:Uncharacterized protein n=1 Tax=Tanacetum coccineum TaxID=301880 RepID=A0ABQ5ANV3_9ASTR